MKYLTTVIDCVLLRNIAVKTNNSALFSLLKNVKKLTTFAVETTAKFAKVNLQRSTFYIKGASPKSVVERFATL